MKAKTPAPATRLTDREFHEGMKQYWAAFRRLPQAKKRARLISWGVLNPDGSIKHFPMDHVPYGPRN